MSDRKTTEEQLIEVVTTQRVVTDTVGITLRVVFGFLISLVFFAPLWTIPIWGFTTLWALHRMTKPVK